MINWYVKKKIKITWCDVENNENHKLLTLNAERCCIYTRHHVTTWGREREIPIVKYLKHGSQVSIFITQKCGFCHHSYLSFEAVEIIEHVLFDYGSIHSLALYTSISEALLPGSCFSDVLTLVDARG